MDLADMHTSIGAMYMNEEKFKNLDNHREFELSNGQLDKFWEDGFIANIPVLSVEQCDRILQDYQDLIGMSQDDSRFPLMYEYHTNQSGDPNNVLFHGLGQWRIYETFHDLMFHPKIVVPASQLIVKDKRSDIRWWHDQLFAKPPQHGGNVAWHQDYSYWTRTQPMAHLTVHIALDDQTVENGALHYIPGSHRWTRNGGNPLPVTDFNFVDMESIKTILTKEELSEFKPVPALLKKGEVSFHHALAVHGSYGNRSDGPRRATVLNYIADGVISNTDEELLAGIRVKKGDQMSGKYFPLVYEVKS